MKPPSAKDCYTPTGVMVVVVVVIVVVMIVVIMVEMAHNTVVAA